MKSLRSIALATTLLCVAACGGSGGESGPGNTLDRGLPSDPETLDQHKARSTQAAEVLRDIGEGLLGYSAAGELEPAAAERWEISEDGLTYTFHLREGLRWSTGEQLVAAHFVAGMRRLVNPATTAFYSQMLMDIENADGIVSGDIPVSMLGVSAPDERTLVMRLVQPTPYLLSLLTHPSTFPIHPGSLDEHGDAFARPGRHVSNGAYTLEAWIPGSLVSLKRNEHYWNNAATAIDAVNYHILVQANSELNRYRAGELHVTSNVPTDSFRQVREEYGDELRVAPYLAVYYYGYNLSKPPFRDNLALREALSIAIDREQLAEKIVGRGEQPAYSWVPPGVNNYEPTRMSIAGLDRDERERRARVRYKEAGYGPENPLRVEIRYNTSDLHQRVAVAIQAMWKDVLGVEATLVNEEFQVLLANMREAEITQVFRSSWTGDYRDAHTFLSILQGGNSANMPRYASAEYDELMARAAAQVDAGRRRLYLEEAERIMLADHPVIPLYVFVSKHLVRPEVRGWGDNVLDYHYSRHLSLGVPD
ncbi:MAG: peptide ABC transporter substrate-binding protein [Gammaproteobacteria bacterium]|nr:peptide ABC transporter substrate-binding protein [Gammaproteobacteria bacterium]